MKKKRFFSLILVSVVIACYFIFYYVLSRDGFKFSRQYNIPGFYFLNPPHPTNTWFILNYGLVVLYYPLIYLDNKIGWGMPIAHEPSWRIKEDSDEKDK